MGLFALGLGPGALALMIVFFSPPIQYEAGKRKPLLDRESKSTSYAVHPLW